MASSPLIGFVILLIIGVVLNSQQSISPLFATVGGVLALIGGLGFAVYILRLLRVLK